MKKLTSFLICVIFLCIISSCGKIENSSEHMEKNITSFSQQETESQTEENITEEFTTEWVNPYAENYRVVSKQNISYIDEWMGEWDTLFLADAFHELEYDKKNGDEGCVAIVMLTNIEGVDEKEQSKPTCYFEIEKILEHNGVGNEINENDALKIEISQYWTLCDDGSYEILVHPAVMPFAEIGSYYVVNLSKYHNGEYSISALSLPFIEDGIYTDTVAVGNRQHKAMSAQTLWYYDINPSYYYEVWEDEEVNRFKDMGVDVFDKSYVQWQLEDWWG